MVLWIQARKRKNVVPTERNLKTHDFLTIFNALQSESSLVSEMCDLRHVKHENVTAAHFALEKFNFGWRIKNGTEVVSSEISLYGHNIFPFASLDTQHRKISRGPKVV